MFLELSRWQWAALAFFGYTAACAVLLHGLRRGARARCIAGCAAGLFFALVPAGFHALPPISTTLLLPALVLLLGYWSSGLLFRAPSPRVEQALAAFDRRARIRHVSSSLPRFIAELLEFSYAAVYALIPIALVIHLSVATAPDVERFWTVILVTDFVCFAMLPWIQSRPPRAIETGEPWRSSFRAFNLRVLGAASIRVNTCPSGHAAEALAAALLVSNAAPLVFAGMLFSAAAVSAGAVYGRYHYAVDAMTGWVVAILVWAVFFVGG